MAETGLVFEDFSDKLEQAFTVAEEGVPQLKLTLTEAELIAGRAAPVTKRPPFSLIFVGEGPRLLEQRLYRMHHAAMGEITLFLVPVGRDERGFQYQALFN